VQIPTWDDGPSVRHRTDGLTSNGPARVAIPCDAQLQNGSMATLTEYFNWWVVDEGTGARWLTTYKLSRDDAARAFVGAKPELHTREVRNSPDPCAAAASRRHTDD
jgi:hypothetical protein